MTELNKIYDCVVSHDSELLEQADKILKGESRQLPSREHLQAAMDFYHDMVAHLQYAVQIIDDAADRLDNPGSSADLKAHKELLTQKAEFELIIELAENLPK